MKAKKIVMSMLAAGVILPALSAGVIAAEKSGETPVTYDNRNYIPDPNNPDSPKWAVTIPSSINFSDDNKDIDASVELVALKNGTLPTGDVKVTVKSKNVYKLVNNNREEVSYKLFYGTANTAMSETEIDVATLHDGNTKESGHAVLGNDKAPTRGTYTDTLTYDISHGI